MAKSLIVSGLDIGSEKIKFLTLLFKNGEAEVLSNIEADSDGVRRGIVVNVDKAAQAVRNALFKAFEENDKKIVGVYVSLDGGHIFSVPSKGLISVSRADQKISEEDIQRVLQEAQALNLSSNKEIFDVLPIEYIIDGQGGIKKPVGLQGVRLEASVLALGGFSPYLENLKEAVLSADLDILDMIPSPLAASRAVLTEKQKELGVALVDIGAGTTSLAVFQEGDLIHLAVLPMGSANITNDMAVALRTDTDIAERIKVEYGTCILKGKNTRYKLDLGEEETLAFSQKFITDIIEDRVSEICEEVNKELKKINKEKLLPAGIVLTGGGAKIPRITELAKNKFHLPVRLGKPHIVPGIKDPSYATVCGLVLAGMDSEEKNGRGEFGKSFLSKIKKILRNFIP